MNNLNLTIFLIENIASSREIVWSGIFLISNVTYIITATSLKSKPSYLPKSFFTSGSGLPAAPLILGVILVSRQEDNFWVIPLEPKPIVG